MSERPVTDSDRVAYAIRRVSRWAENYTVNADAAQKRFAMHEALELRKRAEDCRDIVKMLDGSEDDYIAQVRGE